MTHKATKIVIITEKMLLDGVIRILEEAGAHGYTVVAAGGKGDHGVRSRERAAVVDAFSNVRIEVITASREVATHIADTVAARYFEDYAGITYLQDVEVLRIQKF